MTTIDQAMKNYWQKNKKRNIKKKPMEVFNKEQERLIKSYFLAYYEGLTWLKTNEPTPAETEEIWNKIFKELEKYVPKTHNWKRTIRRSK
ncbi:hypothetical protein [endosymbiont DhMRE of Dentiscutata heterogama]|uniref:hypothetical protein n=1 Tax=endosymbiont DhMRE of Dentiscutata heterogama TaxID=1609546 RepID=UPI002AD48547|nr:hypothetical protein [endosymbiont DhMRE of Dentiscutata heterogama]